MRQLPLQQFILMLVLPALILASLLAASLAYLGLRATIIHGFDEKLAIISTTAATFIDAQEHVDLMRPRRLVGLVAGSEGGWFGLDADRHAVVSVDAAGMATTLFELRDFELAIPGDLARWDEQLVFSIGDGRQLVFIALADGSLQRSLTLSAPVLALCRLNDTLVVASGNQLLRIDGHSGEVVVRGPEHNVQLQALTVDGQGGLWGLTAQGQVLLHFDGESLALLSQRPLRMQLPSEGEWSTDTVIEGSDLRPGAGIAWTADQGLMLSSLSLWSVDTVEGVAEEVGYPGFRNEADVRYQRMVRSLRRAQDENNLSYLYTQLLRDRARRIVYGIDPTEGDSHTRMGDVDPDPSPDGSRDSWFKGTVWISDVQFWEEWGLLKSAFAPIVLGGDQIVALAGADISVDSIVAKTRVALLGIAGIAVLSLLLAILISIVIVRGMGRTFRRLKEGALLIGAGKFGLRIQPQGPADLRDLAQTFNQLSEDLSRSLRSSRRAGVDLLSRRADQALEADLVALSAPPSRWHGRRLLGHGCASQGLLLLLAEAPPQLDAVLVLLRQMHLCGSRAEDRVPLLAKLSQPLILAEEEGYQIMLSPGWQCCCLRDGALERLQPEPGQRLTLAEGEGLLLIRQEQELETIDVAALLQGGLSDGAMLGVLP